MRKIFFTVTNDLIYDQRMHRICNSLAEHGFDVTLVGRKRKASLPLTHKKFTQKRIKCWFNKGKLFYAEYNLRLFFYLLPKKMDAVCAIDLDTILPCLTISRSKKIIRIYDAHEFFTELKEVFERPLVQKAWLRIEQKAVPRFPLGYTVSEGLSKEFKSRYGVTYAVIKNVPVLKPLHNEIQSERILLYQGAVNEARGFEFLIPAMQLIHCKLVICGDGNFMPQLRALIKQYNVEQKVELKGMLTPDELWTEARKAYIGIAVPEKEGLNQYLALPNKFFDYMHAGLPQVTVNYPEYQQFNEKYEVAVLINDINPESIAAAVNNLLIHDVLYKRLMDNCLKAREIFNWKQEEKKLLRFYQSIFIN